MMAFPALRWASGGSIYYADYGNCLVRRIAIGTNIVTTVAGDHTLGCGDSGDLGPATSAQIRNPAQIAVDGQDNIYIADYGNCRVREVVHATGIIKTVAGDGSCGYTGDGVAISNAINNAQGVWSDPNGNIFISDTNNFDPALGDTHRPDDDLRWYSSERRLPGRRWPRAFGKILLPRTDHAGQRRQHLCRRRIQLPRPQDYSFCRIRTLNRQSFVRDPACRDDQRLPADYGECGRADHDQRGHGQR